MGADATSVLDDLAAEHDDLDRVLADLQLGQWDLLTPAPGWTVRDQVSHLAFSEELAATAATDEGAFQRRLAELLADLDGAERAPQERGRALVPSEVLDWWRTARARTLTALRARPPGDRVPWVVGEMSVASFATARLMETWAHGQDVCDAIGHDRRPTPRLRHVAHLGVQTRRFSYQVRGRAVPETAVRVELDGPDGATWAWGPHDAPAVVRGPALDFCLVVTQRRHVADTALVAEGDGAAEWLAIAQAFAGPPTDGPEPGRSQPAHRR